MRLTILGAGSSHGTPVIGCTCVTCTSPDPRNHRMRASALIEAHGRAFLVDTGPEVRLQAVRAGIRQIDAVLYTHFHADHVHGIDDLKAFNVPLNGELPCYGNAQTAHVLQTRFDYAFAGTSLLGWIPHLTFKVVEEPFDLLGVPVTPVDLQHGRIRSCGWRIGGMAYLTDANGIPESSLALLGGLDLLVIDGLRPRPHPTHFSMDEAIAIGRAVGAKQTLLTHMNHDVEYVRESASLPPDVALAYDGLVVDLPDP
ncbi:MAG: MBL fold metallo-hydrolase [Chloroflexi bacterium]|nr:MBL fold metallo-hydrolase [Chloroflexota bacterium]